MSLSQGISTISTQKIKSLHTETMLKLLQIFLKIPINIEERENETLISI
jgi:hypothetical protein